jgi:hypothetical protein
MSTRTTFFSVITPCSLVYGEFQEETYDLLGYDAMSFGRYILCEYQRLLLFLDGMPCSLQMATVISRWLF